MQDNNTITTVIWRKEIQIVKKEFPILVYFMSAMTKSTSMLFCKYCNFIITKNYNKHYEHFIIS